VAGEQAVSRLRRVLGDYLRVRRALGFKLDRHEKLLSQFLTYLDDVDATTVTVADALTWARLPEGADPSWWAQRLGVVRGFAAYLQTIDPTTQVPPRDLLPARARRASPYLYSDADIAALITAAGRLSSPHRVNTYQTLLGLLAVTGMRIGEAIRLDVDDFDDVDGVLIVRNTKYGKTRQLPLHPTTVAALADYLQRRIAAPATAAVFTSTAGTRLLYCNVQWTFQRLVATAGLQPRSGLCRPRIHDVRHSFAVHTLLDAGRGADAQRQLTLLSTYLGHVDAKATYWYLTAAPELLALAAERLEQHHGATR
jgi:integrase/recombinase XerD